MSQSLLALLKRYEKYWLPAILVLAFLLRLPLLDGSFWLDEAAQALESSRPLSSQLDIAKDFQPPLYHFWLHLFTYLSHSEWWLRLASLIPGLVTIYVSVLISRRLQYPVFGQFVLALFLATSPFHIYFSQELRPYMLACLFQLLSLHHWYALVKGGNRWLAFSLVTALSWATMYVTPLFSFSLLIITWVYFRSHFPKVLKSFFPSILLCLPLLPLFLEQLQIGLLLKSNLPGWSQVVSLPYLKSLPLTFAKLILGYVNFSMDIPTAILILTILAPTLYLLRRHFISKSMPSWLVALPLIFLFLTYLVSFFIPILEPKRVMVLLPLLYLILTFKLDLRQHFVIICLILAGHFTSIGLYLYSPINQREPWREAISELQYKYRDSITIFAFNEPFAPWVWYAKDTWPTVSFSSMPVNPSELTNLSQTLTPYEHIIVFDYLMDLTDPDRLIHTYLKNHQYQEIDILTYPNLGQIRIFAKKPIYALQP